MIERPATVLKLFTRTIETRLNKEYFRLEWIPRAAIFFSHICTHNHKYLRHFSREAPPDTPAQSERDVIAVFALCNGGGDCAKIFLPQQIYDSAFFPKPGGKRAV